MSESYKFGLSDLSKFNTFLQERDDFSFSSFGTPDKRGCVPPLLHLQLEVKELIDNPDDPMEWADCFLLLLDAARRKGHSIDDLMRFSLEKLAINRQRTWVRNKDDVYFHKNEDTH